MSAAAAGSAPLKRLGGGRWQTRDARFTIEPQSGTWVVVDAEQTDDLGLPLVRGPFSSLTAAKEAIDSARATAAADSPLQARVAASRAHPRSTAPPKGEPAAPSAATHVAKPGVPPAARPAAPKPRPPEPEEPRWLTDMAPTDRRRARLLIERLVADGARDPEGMVRRDITGNVAATAAHAVRAAIEALDREASPAIVARLLADGRDDRLGVRWRLVDDHGRPIPLDLDALDRWAAGAAGGRDHAPARDRATAREGARR